VGYKKYEMDYSFVNDNEMNVMTWKELIFRAANQTAVYALKNMYPLAKDPLFYGYLLAGMSFCMISYSACSCWSEMRRLKRSEQELEEALAETEDELEYERQISSQTAHYLEQEKCRSEAFRKVRDQIGSDSQAWPVIVTNEVLALRTELNEIRKRQVS
jgi:hypothetical protein